MDDAEMVRRLATLTSDNLKVFHLLVSAGRVPKEIARDLNLTYRGVTYHMAEIYRRLELVEMAPTTRFIWLGRYAHVWSHVAPTEDSTPEPDDIPSEHPPPGTMALAVIPPTQLALSASAPMPKDAVAVAIRDAQALDRQRPIPWLTRLLLPVVLAITFFVGWSSRELMGIAPLIVGAEAVSSASCPPQSPRLPLSTRPGGYTATIETPQFCALGIRAGEAIAVSGTITGDLAAKETWVLVAAPNGELYPQSPDPCRGLPARASDGRWESKVTFGGPTNRSTSYDLIVAVAPVDGKASFVLKEWLNSGCADPGRFGRGLAGAQLPDLLELATTSVVTARN